MLIHVVQGKGRKDRYTTLSEVALTELRNYTKEYNPETWLFPGQNPKKFITERTVQRVFENAKMKAGIKRKVSVHSLSYPNLYKIQTFGFFKTCFCNTFVGRRNRFKVYTGIARPF